MNSERRMITIPVGGRPKKVYPDTFWVQIASERQNMTQQEMAQLHGVSVPTIARWIRAAKDKGVMPDARKPSR